jgi:hypothetical protein
MRILALCAIVIAGSTFATAVESIYGWSNVKPVAQQTWDTTYKWGAEKVDQAFQLGDEISKIDLNRKDNTAHVN